MTQLSTHIEHHVGFFLRRFLVKHVDERETRERGVGIEELPCFSRVHAMFLQRLVTLNYTAVKITRVLCHKFTIKIALNDRCCVRLPLVVIELAI